MSSRCFHCSEPVPNGFNAQVCFDGKFRETCCFGCQAVMQAIIDAGLSDYYRFRSEPARPLSIDQDDIDSLRIFDEPEYRAKLLTRSADSATNGIGLQGSEVELAEVTLSVEGIRCGACIWLLERTLRALPDIDEAVVNGSTHRAFIRFNVSRLPLSTILRCIHNIGYEAVPLDIRQREQRLADESRSQIQRLFVAGIAMMQIMMFSLPGYLDGESQIAAAHLKLLHWASMVLAIPIVFFSSTPFFNGAWKSIRTLRMGMDVPVSIGIVVAFSASVWNTLWADGETYFDSVSMFVFLLLLARYLEWAVRCRSVRAIDDVSSHIADKACQLIDGEFQLVPASRLQVGDLIRVDSGQTVPVNAVITTAGTVVNCSVLSGESEPISLGKGDEVPGGAQVVGAPVTCRVTAIQQHSTLSVIGMLVNRGAADKPELANIADQVAYYFVWCLLSLSLLVFLCWWWIDASRAITVAVTVLVVSCPCALSLATPLAFASSASRLIHSKLLITRGHVLETTAKITDVVLDKTGTLTHGTPTVLAVDTVAHCDKAHAIGIAAALEEGAAHPFAQAIREMAGDEKTPEMTFTKLRHEAGGGIVAMTGEGITLRLGSARWCGLDESHVDRVFHAQSIHSQPASYVFLCESSDENFSRPTAVARFALADTLRDEAADMVTELRHRGLTVHLLSGDQHDVVENCAKRLDIDTWSSASRPEDKQRYVKSLQQNGACVLMVGDGINDAPVLATADVSVAIGNATSLARTTADVISLASDLTVLPLLLRQSQSTMRVVRQNLLWAFAYNMSAIPAASLGLVSPWLAAIGMASSSLLVAVNAARLMRISNNSSVKERFISTGALVWNH